MIVVALLAALAAMVQEAELRVLRPGEVIEEVIEDGDPIVDTEALRADAYTREHAVIGKAFLVQVGEPGTYRVELTSSFFDGYLVLRAAGGDVLAEDDDGLIGLHSRVVTTLAPGDAVRIEACALHGGRGRFELRLEPGEPRTLSPRERREAELADARRGTEALESALGREHPAVARSLNDLGELLRVQGDFGGARALHERALSIREKAFGPGHPHVATSLNNLSLVLQALGDLDAARPLCERALSIREKALGPEHLHVAISLNNLSLVLQAQGDLGGATPLCERALAIREKALGSAHPDVAQSLNNLANLLQARGDPAAARPLHERALSIREEALGPEHPDVANSLNNLAYLLRAQGDSGAAKPLYERALSIREEVLPPEHPDLAESLGNLAELLRAQGDLGAARPLYERVLSIWENVLGPDHPYVANILNNFALLLDDQGDSAAARALHERALAILEEALGPGHFDVATIVYNLAEVLRAQGDFGGARQLHERCLRICEELLGPEHPEVALSLSSLADVLRAQGDLAAARPLHERALAIREKAFGSEHLDVAASLNGLGEVLRDQGDFAAARALHERALAIREKALGPEHTEVANSLNSVAALLYDQGDYSAARPLFERALAIREKAQGPEHPDVATNVNNLAALRWAQRDYVAATLLFERALSLCEKSLGPEHPDVATSVNNLAALLYEQGDSSAARPLFERALSIREKALGPEHVHVAISLNNLAALLSDLGEHGAARPLSERALSIYEKALGPEHPDVARSLHNLAAVLADEGSLAEAVVLLDRGERDRRAALGRVLAGLSEGEMHKYLAELSWQRQLHLSVVSWGAPSVRVYESLLAWKAQVLRLSRIGRARLLGSLTPEARDKLDRLHGIQALLSRTVTRADAPADGLDPRDLEALVAERGRLERELQQSEDPLRVVPPTFEQVQASLPSRSALVDLFVHRVYLPAEGEGGQPRRKGEWSEPRVSAWVTRAGSDAPVHRDLGLASAMEDAVRRSLQHDVADARGGSLGTALDPSASLRQLLWDPLAEHLDGVDLVFVSPDGVLATLPFEILRGDDGRYLVEDRGFVYLTDPGILVEVAGRSAGRNVASLLAIGGVDYSRADDFQARDRLREDESSLAQDLQATGDPASDLRKGSFNEAWGSLSATQPEAQQVQALHTRSHADGTRLLLEGAAVTEERLKSELPRHSVLHLATHGYFQPEGWASLEDAAEAAFEQTREQPWQESFSDVTQRLEGYHPGLLSGLVCAGVNRGLSEDRDDGYLTAEEVSWLDLSKVDLAVLSACDTGLGRPQSGEGLIGLRRAFLMAGARTVVSSLWSVRDQATAELMDLFYRNLWQRGMGKHEALRAAQLETLAKNRALHGHARPATWGAFVLDGDWR